jgi:CO/xanthine dehydrogenase Mo-binding subunit
MNTTIATAARMSAYSVIVWPEVLCCDINDVRPLVGDTDSIGFTDGTGGSRVTLATGLAVYDGGTSRAAATEGTRG